MKIVVTAREALEEGYWAELCSVKGLNVWITSEGLTNEDDTFELTLEEAKELGLIRR